MLKAQRKAQTKRATDALIQRTQALYGKINAWIADKMTTRSKVSVTKRRHQAAAEFDVSYDTVMEAQKTIREN